MHIQRAEQLPGADIFPDPEINAFPVVPNHPAQVHIEPFAGRFAQGCGYVLLRARGMRQREELAVKTRECRAGVFVGRGQVIGKGIFEARMLPVVVLQETEEVAEVGEVECAVHKRAEGLEVGIGVMQDKAVRTEIHAFFEELTVADDGFALSPGEYSGEKAHDLDVRFFSVPVGNRDRVVGDECGLIIPFDQFLQKIIQLFSVHKSRCKIVTSVIL